MYSVRATVHCPAILDQQDYLLKVPVFEQGFNHVINTITSFVKKDFHIQDWADFRVRVGKFLDFEVVCILDMLSA